MDEELETATATTVGGGADASTQSTLDLQNPDNGETTIFHEPNVYSDIESACSTPYVSAPSSPGRVGVSGGGGGFYYSAPASPMHFMLYSTSPNSKSPGSEGSMSGSFEFEFSARFGSVGSAPGGSMSSADELFLNGQIRPMKLSTHLQRPQVLAPLLDLDEAEGNCENVMDEADRFPRGRDGKWRDRSLRRRTRSMSPLRMSSFQWQESDEEEEEEENKTQNNKQSVSTFESLESKQNEVESTETTPSASASSSRSSSVSRSSKKWVFLKDFLYRSKSEGRNNGHKFWSSISFSPIKDRKASTPSESTASSKDKTATSATAESPAVEAKKEEQSLKEPSKKGAAGKAFNRVGKGKGKRRGAAPSPHELHYTAKRAQAEEMRKKTFLPYRQGLLGCLGFSSKSYGAMNGIARALNPVSSR